MKNFYKLRSGAAGKSGVLLTTCQFISTLETIIIHLHHMSAICNIDKVVSTIFVRDDISAIFHIELDTLYTAFL